MSHAPEFSMPHTGDILGGRYILRERIGAGGMGRVFRARDEVLARDVAIKIFHADGTGEDEPLRRMPEAPALDHPSLVTLYDARLVGEKQVYLVTELIAGRSVDRRPGARRVGRDGQTGFPRPFGRGPQGQGPRSLGQELMGVNGAGVRARP